MRFQRKTFKTCQIFNKKIPNASDFETKISQPVRFWFECFTRRQILDWKKFNALNFEIKNFTTCQILEKNVFLKSTILREKIIFKKHELEEEVFLKKQFFKKNFACKKSRFGSIYSVKCANFVVYVQF